jgi:hypothetical protein
MEKLERLGCPKPVVGLVGGARHHEPDRQQMGSGSTNPTATMSHRNRASRLPGAAG